jgi:hypothetical protein
MFDVLISLDYGLQDSKYQGRYGYSQRFGPPFQKFAIIMVKL